MLFENMDLDEKLLSALKAERFTTPTEIQKQAIPSILAGKDLLATAETGSGKTAAYILPALMQLLKAPRTKGRGARVLVLAPTRELVHQIADTTKRLSRSMQIRFGTIIGGVSYFHQENLLRNPLDLLIATPGRLMDHMKQGRVDYSRVELFVIDEADRMLDMGFRKDIETIFKALPAEHQNLLFSATINDEIQRIAKQFLKNPHYLELARSTPHALISQQIHQVDDYKHKCEILFHILESANVWQAIVFTKTKRGAEKLAEELYAKRISSAALHGDMKQSKRTSTLERMHRGDLKVLVATDVAGRGIDVKKLSHVLNFDLPNSVEDYIHRIGRTGRRGEQGTAISLVDAQGWSLISRIERFTGHALERKVISGLEPKQGQGRSKPGKPKQGGRPNQQNKRRFGSRTASANPNAKVNPRSKDQSSKRFGNRVKSK